MECTQLAGEDSPRGSNVFHTYVSGREKAILRTFAQLATAKSKWEFLESVRGRAPPSADRGSSPRPDVPNMRA